MAHRVTRVHAVGAGAGGLSVVLNRRTPDGHPRCRSRSVSKPVDNSRLSVEEADRVTCSHLIQEAVSAGDGAPREKTVTIDAEELAQCVARA